MLLCQSAADLSLIHGASHPPMVTVATCLCGAVNYVHLNSKRHQVLLCQSAADLSLIHGASHPPMVTVATCLCGAGELCSPE